MQYYLVDTTHEVFDDAGVFLGYRICDLASEQFPVAEYLKWVPAERIRDIYTGLWYMDKDGVIGERVFKGSPKSIPGTTL